MKATLLLLIGLASLMGAPLEPVSAIDFGPALHFTNAHPYLSIRYLAATSDGPTAIGGSEIAEIGIARANRGGSNVQVTRLQSSAGAIGRFAMRPDGSFWTMSQWDHPFTPVQPVLGGGDARTPVGRPSLSGIPPQPDHFPSTTLGPQPAMIFTRPMAGDWNLFGPSPLLSILPPRRMRSHLFQETSYASDMSRTETLSMIATGASTVRIWCSRSITTALPS